MPCSWSWAQWAGERLCCLCAPSTELRHERLRRQVPMPEYLMYLIRCVPCCEPGSWACQHITACPLVALDPVLGLYLPRWHGHIHSWQLYLAGRGSTVGSFAICRSWGQGDRAVYQGQLTEAMLSGDEIAIHRQADAMAEGLLAQATSVGT